MANDASATVARRRLSWRLGLLYAALFLVVGFNMPYLPVWLKWRHLNADQIAILLAAPLYIRIVITPAIGFLADRLGGRRAILITLTWGSLGSFFLLWLSDGFWQMLLVVVLLAMNWTTVMPLVETAAVSGIRTSGIDYGRVRLWGSLSFICASLGGGLAIQVAGPGAVLPLILAAGALLVLGAYLVPRDLKAGAGRVGLRRLKARDAFALAHSPLFLLFLLAVSLIQGSHSLLYAFGSLHWHAQGFSGGTIGVLWSVGVIVEIALFAVSGRVIAQVGAARLMTLAGVAAVVRWGFLAIDPPLWATALLQTLHAMSFGATHLATIHFLTHAVPEDRAATAQGLYSSVVAGLAMGTVTLACGPLYRLLGGEAYGVMALLALVGTGAAFLLSRRWHGGTVVGAVDPVRLPSA